MNLPIFDSKYILVRGRVAIAIILSIFLLPELQNTLPGYSSSHATNISYILIEIAIGFIISIAAKLYFSTVYFVGQIISMQSGLAMANFYDPNQKTQIALFSNIIALMTVVYLLAAEGHYYFIQSIVDSYIKFPPGNLIETSEMSYFVSKVFNDSFVLAFKLVSPFMVVSLAVLTGSGLLARLMPNLQVFFVITPAQIIIVISTIYVVINRLMDRVSEMVINSVDVLNF